MIHDNKEIHKLSLKPADITCSLENINGSNQGTILETGIPCEGDTIGVAYDHVELNFYLNGKKLDIPTLNVKGTVYPALYGMFISVSLFFQKYINLFLLSVDDGAVLDIILDDFNYGPPPGFEKIMIEQSLL